MKVQLRLGLTLKSSIPPLTFKTMKEFFGRKVLTTVSAKFNRSRVQTAPVTLLSILQTRLWYQSKELGILLQKHPQHVGIDQFKPEKIKFKD